VVLAANIAATWLAAAAIADNGVFGEEAHAAFRSISEHAVASPFSVTLFR
jgi:hypothetical protein